MNGTKNQNQYSERESAQRFDQALRGAVKTPHKPQASMTPKRPKRQRKAGKKR